MPPLALALCLLAGGCASFDGSGLVAGKSTAADVEFLMGAPSERLARIDGDSVWYFSRLPAGRAIFAVALGTDGVVKSIEPTLTRDNIARLELDATTRSQVRQLFGPPYRSTRAPLKPLEIWEYPWREVADKRTLSIGFSDDDVVREVIDLRDLSDQPGGRSRRR